MSPKRARSWDCFQRAKARAADKASLKAPSGAKQLPWGRQGLYNRSCGLGGYRTTRSTPERLEHLGREQLIHGKSKDITRVHKTELTRVKPGFWQYLERPEWK